MSRLHHAARPRNTNHDPAGNPEAMPERHVAEMEQALVESRRETLEAIARQKRLGRKVQAAAQIAAELEQDASLARDNDNEEMARKILIRRSEVLRRGESLREELERATARTRRIKSEMLRVQRQVELARGRNDEPPRRERTAAGSTGSC